MKFYRVQPEDFICKHCWMKAGTPCVTFDITSKAQRAHKNRTDKAYGANVALKNLQDRLNNIPQIIGETK
jgi:hypothetical protein